jgi:phosphatidate cytidylyltransferase
MAEKNSAEAGRSRMQIFVRRLISSVILWTIIIGALFSGNRLVADYVFLLMIAGLGGLGLVEFYGLAQKRRLACFPRLGIAAGLLLIIATFFRLSGDFAPPPSPGEVNDFETPFLVLFVLGLCVRQFLSKRNADGLVAISLTLLGLMYVVWLLNFVQKIYFFPGVAGNWYLLYFVLVTKFSDIGAYCVGSLIGRHKMIPRISPGKTWEGFGGAILASTLVSLAALWVAGDRLAGMTVTHAIILGILLSGTAVIGDLVESLFKREAGVKDSGRLLPGIGGILDLLDSLLFNAPLMYLYLRYVLV